MECPRCGEQLADDARFCGACGANLATDPNVGRIIARRYVLRERIGTGSLGLVYRAEQLGIGRKLAIKLLPPAANRDPQLVRRFKREGTVLCRLRSPHTVTTYELDRDDDGSLYIAMEVPVGRTLADVIERDGALPWPRALGILSGLCESLAEAHSLGVVHRDLRPENILLEDRVGRPDFVKVLDFGLAKLLGADAAISHPGQVVGSTAFSSPEQLLRRPLDGRADIYSLGILAFVLLTGAHPFADAKSPGDLIEAHVQRIAPPPSTLAPNVTRDIDALVARCLVKDPELRFPDVAALDAAIAVAARARDGTDTIPEETRGDEDTMLAGVPERPKR